MSLIRTPEPPPADIRAECWLYHEMDHSEVNQRFVDDFLGRGLDGTAAASLHRRIIDLGCGPGDIAIRVCKSDPAAHVMAVDNEAEMLEIAKMEIDIAGMLARIQLEQADITAMDAFADGMADAVISNTVLHHLDDPAAGIAAAVRLVRPGGRVFIRDLFRPADQAAVESIVQSVAGDESDFAKQLLRQSLHASLSVDEAQSIVRGLGIDPPCVQMTSNRHWTLDWTKPE